MSYYVYNNQSDANYNAENIYIDMLEEIADAHSGQIMLDPETQAVGAYSELTRSEKLELKIFGYKDGVRNYSGGFTTKATEVYESALGGTWYFNATDHVDNVSDYAEIRDSIPTSWVNLD